MIDDLSTQRYASLFDLPASGRYRFHQASILGPDLDDLLDGADVVVHLAAITNAEESFGIAESVTHVNVDGTERVARACLRSNAQLIFVSTTSVYGVQEGLVDEDCDLEQLRPQSPYASSKLAGERALQRLAAQGLRSVTFRFGTIAGVSPGMRFHTAVNKFCWQAVMGHPLTVWRTALRQRRPYLDLTDGVRAIGMAIEKRLDRGLYNVLTTNATVEEIVGWIREAVPDVAVAESESRAMNQLSYEVDGSRFLAVGFEITGDLRRAIRETIALLAAANGAQVGRRVSPPSAVRGGT